MTVATRTVATRRVALLAAIAGAAASAAAAKPAAKAAPKRTAAPAAMDHSKMGHSGMPMPENDVALSPQETAVVAALTRCRIASEQCLSFAIEALGAGQTDMKGCAQSTRETALLCEVTVGLITMRSKLARTQMALCRQACMESKSESDVHAAHHWPCKANAQACDAAIDALNAILG